MTKTIQSRPTIRLLLAALFSACTLLATNVHAADTPMPSASVSDNDPFADAMKSGRAHVKSKNWRAAARDFESAVKLNDKDADAHNMLAFSLRNNSDLDRAKKHYDIALKINPKHLGAHEYVGQLHLKLNQLAEAEKHLASLATLCQKKCEEYDDLAQSIAAFKKK